MAEKTTHFGRAGEFFVMSELLLRGWNVAVPVVDVGDDAFVIDDNDKTTWRLQVKSAEAHVTGEGPLKASFSLSRAQLRTVQAIELFYMFLVRANEEWHFLVVPREDLATIRKDYVEKSTAQPARGRPPVDDGEAKGDTVTLNIEVSDDDVTGWKASFGKYRGRWPDALAPVSQGPGTVRRSAPPAPDAGTTAVNPAAEGPPAPSPDPEK
jgi:hypothetical protein